MRKLLILEINEVPFKVYDHYMKESPDSTLSKILNQSSQYITVSTDQGELHPWSTWPTLYRGVDNTIHGIKDLGEDLTQRNREYPPVWDVLTKKGIKAGIFSSLHTYPLPGDLNNYMFLVPDPFAHGDDTLPENVRPFQSFNLAMSRRSGRSVDTGIDKGKAFKLLFRLPALGTRASTVIKVAKQLIAEKTAPWKASRRRTFQSVLAFDLFLKLLKKSKPTFTTFFSNHVASAMHRYWAATFPEDYEQNDLPKDWINRYKGEIPYCMMQLDNMLVDIVKFLKKNPEYKLIIASSMGQEATEATMINQELFLTDFDRFKGVFNSNSVEQRPAMHPQYNFEASEENAEEVENTLKEITINGEPIKYRKKEKTFFSVDLGYPNVEDFEVKIASESKKIEDLGFEIKKIDDQSGGTAYHIPQGSLFVYDPQNPVSPERKEVDLREVAPSILKLFGLEIPAYMREGEIKAIYS